MVLSILALIISLISLLISLLPSESRIKLQNRATKALIKPQGTVISPSKRAAIKQALTDLEHETQ